MINERAQPLVYRGVTPCPAPRRHRPYEIALPTRQPTAPAPPHAGKGTRSASLGNAPGSLKKPVLRKGTGLPVPYEPHHQPGFSP